MKNYAVVAIYEGVNTAQPYRSQLMTLRGELTGSHCLTFELLTWDNFTVRLLPEDGPEKTLLTRYPLPEPLWQTFSVGIHGTYSSAIHIVFDSYQTPGATSHMYNTALNNVVIKPINGYCGESKLLINLGTSYFVEFRVIISHFLF